MSDHSQLIKHMDRETGRKLCEEGLPCPEGNDDVIVGYADQYAYEQQEGAKSES